MVASIAAFFSVSDFDLSFKDGFIEYGIQDHVALAMREK